MSIDKEIAKEKARLRQKRKSAYLKELSDSQDMSEDGARNFIRNKLDKNYLARELAKTKDGALDIGVPEDCHRVRLPEVKYEMASLHPLIQNHIKELQSKTLHFFYLR